MNSFNCKCLLEYKAFHLSDEKKEKGGPFTFIVNKQYNCIVIENDYWGDCYSMTDDVTGFTIGFSKEQFDKHFVIC